MRYLQTYKTLTLVILAYNIAMDKANGNKEALSQLDFIDDIKHEISCRNISEKTFNSWIDRHHVGGLN